MKATRVEQQIIRKSHPQWKTIDEMCFNEKNLYNYAMYIIRQEYIKSGKYIKYYDMNFTLKTHKQYKDSMRQPDNSVLSLLHKHSTSFLEALTEH